MWEKKWDHSTSKGVERSCILGIEIGNVEWRGARDCSFVINITVISSILDPTLHFAGIYFTVYYFTRASVLHTCHVLPLQRRELYVIFFLPGLFFRSPPLFPSYSLNFRSGTSLVVQWLRLWAPSPGGPGLILGQGARSHMLQLRPRAAKLKKKKNSGQSSLTEGFPNCIWLFLCYTL